MSEPIKVDFEAKKTEAEWQSSVDKFWLSATPELFKWLGWVAALAALRFVGEQSHNKWVSGLHAFCLVALVFYFNAYFFRFQFTNLPFRNHPKARWFGTLTVSGLLGMAALFFSIQLVNAIAKSRL